LLFLAAEASAPASAAGGGTGVVGVLSAIAEMLDI
jgi:hypothetical protein